MATARKPARYPWGTTPPRPRLRDVSAKVRKALDAAKSPGFTHVSVSVAGAVQASRPLVEVLRHLSDVGLRPSATSVGEPVAPDEVSAAVALVDGSVRDLAGASALELSDRYRAFSESVAALLAVADKSSRLGIARPREARSESGWAVFEP